MLISRNIMLFFITCVNWRASENNVYISAEGQNRTECEKNIEDLKDFFSCGVLVKVANRLREVIKKSKWKFKMVFAIRRRPPPP